MHIEGVFGTVPKVGNNRCDRGYRRHAQPLELVEVPPLHVGRKAKFGSLGAIQLAGVAGEDASRFGTSAPLQRKPMLGRQEIGWVGGQLIAPLKRLQQRFHNGNTGIGFRQRQPLGCYRKRLVRWHPLHPKPVEHGGSDSSRVGYWEARGQHCDLARGQVHLGSGMENPIRARHELG